MIPCALVALANIKFKLDVRPKSVLLSMGVGILGAAGQLVLFEALKFGPAYLVYPMIAVAPPLPAPALLASAGRRMR